MKARIIACEVFYRELSLALAHSPHILDIKFMDSDLHNTPSELRSAIQSEIDASEGQGYDYIILGYGLCSRGTADITARSIPLVIPKAHDCITFFLGSRVRYGKEFIEHPGTYYYSSGWIEHKDGEVQQGFIEEGISKDRDRRYAEYVEKYGEDNAKFLIEQESQWLQHYTRAVFINMGIGNVEVYRKFVDDVAARHEWKSDEIPGDLSLLTRLANGNWNDDYLIVMPGETVKESFDENVICAHCRD